MDLNDYYHRTRVPEIPLGEEPRQETAMEADVSLGEAYPEDANFDTRTGLPIGRAMLDSSVDGPVAGQGEEPESATVSAQEDAAEDAAVPAADGPLEPPPVDPPDLAPPPADDPGDDQPSEGDPERTGLARIREVEDPQLAQLVGQALDAIDEEVLDRIVTSAERFGFAFSTEVVESSSSETVAGVDGNATHKAILEELPGYMRAADTAGVSVDQATDLLTHALDAANFPYPQQTGNIAANLRHALDAVSRSGEQFTPEHLDALKEVVTTAGQYDTISMGVSAYAAACRAGLSPDASAQLVQGYFATTTTYTQANARIDHFRDALRTLDGAGADPGAVEVVFKHIEGQDPQYRRVTYDQLGRAVTFGAVGRGQTAAEAMESIQDIARQTEAGEPLDLDVYTRAMVSAAPPMERDRHFREAEGVLEHRATPYRVEGRSWAAGAEDIAGLTHADSAKGDTVAEGNWVYDSDRGTWFSLGGQTTEIAPGYARHLSARYDVSELSRNPVSVHVHPNEFIDGPQRVSSVLPSYDDYTQVADRLRSAQGTIDTSRSFIFHPLGVTEYTYPNDSTAVHDVAVGFEMVRARYLDALGGAGEIASITEAIGEETLVRAMLEDLSTVLPDGFELKYYPPGTLPEDIE